MSVKSFDEFDVKIVEDPTDLANLRETVKSYKEESKKLSESKATEEKVKDILSSNWLLMESIENAIGGKLNPEFSKQWESDKVVVSYDKKNHYPQAFGIIEPEFNYNGMICSEIFAIATSYWNIQCPPTHISKKVKGAGTSIVRFCSQQGKQYGSHGEIYLLSVKSAISYYQNKLHFKIAGEIDGGKTPMFLDAVEAKKLDSFFPDFFAR